jgi:multidrug resistance efflux pump
MFRINSTILEVGTHIAHETFYSYQTLCGARRHYHIASIGSLLASSRRFSLRRTYTNNGRLEADRITVSTEYAGRISRLYAAKGDQVKTGKVMARLDNDPVQKRLSQAEDALTRFQIQVAAAEKALIIQKREI